MLMCAGTGASQACNKARAERPAACLPSVHTGPRTEHEDVLSTDEAYVRYDAIYEKQLTIQGRVATASGSRTEPTSVSAGGDQSCDSQHALAVGDDEAVHELPQRVQPCAQPGYDWSADASCTVASSCMPLSVLHNLGSEDMAASGRRAVAIGRSPDAMICAIWMLGDT
jgi:hypothetical protein